MAVDPAARQKAREWLAARAPEAERHRRELAVERVYIPRQAPREIAGGRIELYDVVATTLGDVPLQYLEFGVFSGRSLAEIANRFRHPEARFFGFDSFEGLPEAWGDMGPATFTRRGLVPVSAIRASALSGAGFRTAFPTSSLPPASATTSPFWCTTTPISILRHCSF